MKEKELHDLIIENSKIRKKLLALLSIEGENISFIHEDQYPNGLYADFTIKCGNAVKAIIECKGSNIGANDYVRGIGQILQYQHFADSNLSVKGYEYKDTCAVYCFPSSIIKNKNFNIGLFKYPEKCKIVELNEKNQNLRLISQAELNVLADASRKNIVTISQYYVRDNRLYELYLCLKYCQFKGVLGFEKVDRKDAETTFLCKLETPNNKNWRNAFISLSSLGLIDNNNLPTWVGAGYASLDFSEFCYEIYTSYIKDYIDLLMTILMKISEKENKEYFEVKYNDISEMIRELYNGKDVLFVTDSGNRYLSSWLNIMRDDFKCVEFASRSNIRKISYVINHLNRETIISKIKKNEEAYRYIKKYNELLKKI